MFSNCCQRQTAACGQDSNNTQCTDEKLLSQYYYVQQNWGTQHPGGASRGDADCVISALLNMLLQNCKI